MRFELAQWFAAPVPVVAAAFVDPDRLALVASLPDLGRPQLLELTEQGDTVVQRVRYAFTGDLSPAVTAVIDPDRLTWVEETVLDRQSYRTRLRIRPDHYPDRLYCAGTITLAAGDGGTRRLTEADLRVRFPLVGGRVERAIVNGLREHAAAEEAVVQRWLDGPRSG